MTKNFKLEEFLYSHTAAVSKIDNSPPREVLERLKLTAEKLEGIREALGKPLKITSGYRSPELNRFIGGTKRSQHVKGEAVDFISPAFGTPKQILEALAPRVRELGIDQIICEGSWVHVSFSDTPRYQVMSYVKGKFVNGVA